MRFGRRRDDPWAREKDPWPEPVWATEWIVVVAGISFFQGHTYSRHDDEYDALRDADELIGLLRDEDVDWIECERIDGGTDLRIRANTIDRVWVTQRNYVARYAREDPGKPTS